MQRKKYDWETVSENILCRAYSRSATDIILSKNNGSLLFIMLHLGSGTNFLHLFVKKEKERMIEM